jgi:hypothetical protein
MSTLSMSIALPTWLGVGERARRGSVRNHSIAGVAEAGERRLLALRRFPAQDVPNGNQEAHAA